MRKAFFITKIILIRNKIVNINNTSLLKIAMTNKIIIKNWYNVLISAWETPLIPIITYIVVSAIVTNAKSVMPIIVYFCK
jgi:hypothetical protein